jgi:hypothetical protein
MGVKKSKKESSGFDYKDLSAYQSLSIKIAIDRKGLAF